MPEIAVAALSLAEFGFYPVKLHYPIFREGQQDSIGCSCGSKDCQQRSHGKHPVGNQWGKSATQDPEVIAERFSGADWNVGIILGPCHGIPHEQAVVDIEDDSEEGRALADALLGDYPAPSYTSGKSLHRIYRWTPDLPSTASFSIAGLEFRFGGNGIQCQSAAPPTIHWSGSQYAWIDGKSPADLPIVPLPKHVIEYVCQEYARDHESKSSPSSGDARKFKSPIGKIQPGGRHHALLKYANSCWRDAYTLYGINGIEEQETLDRVWMWVAGANLLVCDPPKTEAEVAVIYNSTRDYMRSEFLREIEEKLQESETGDAPEDSFGSWLHERGIQMQIDKKLKWNEKSKDRTDEWICDWTIEMLSKTDEQMVRVNFQKPEPMSVTVRQVEFEKPEPFARRIQAETGGKIVLDRTFSYWNWKTIWLGKSNGSNKKTGQSYGITRGLKEHLVNKALVVAREEGGLSEQIEDIILTLAGSLGPLMNGLEKWSGSSRQSSAFTGRMKLDPQGENLMLSRLPEDPLTGWYSMDDSISLFVKAPEVIQRYKGIYGKLENANAVVGETLKEMGFERKRISHGAMEGRWFVKSHKTQPPEETSE